MINGYIKYIKPIRYIEEYYNGEMIHFDNKYINFNVTPNHNMYIKQNNSWEFIRSDKIYNKMVRVKKNANNNYKDHKYIRIGIDKYLLDDWLKLIGIYISYGYLQINTIYLSCF